MIAALPEMKRQEFLRRLEAFYSETAEVTSLPYLLDPFGDMDLRVSSPNYQSVIDQQSIK